MMSTKEKQPEIYQFFFAAKNELSVRSLFKKFFDNEISRRDFGTKLLALGFSQIAVNTFLGAAVEARAPLPQT